MNSTFLPVGQKWQLWCMLVYFVFPAVSELESPKGTWEKGWRRVFSERHEEEEEGILMQLQQFSSCGRIRCRIGWLCLVLTVPCDLCLVLTVPCTAPCTAVGGLNDDQHCTGVVQSQQIPWHFHICPQHKMKIRFLKIFCDISVYLHSALFLWRRSWL